MPSRRNWYVAMMLIFIAGVGCVFLSRTDSQAGNTPTAGSSIAPPPAQSAPRAGFLSPEFSLYTLEGRQISLQGYRGDHAVIINFWATWCPPCRAEMPALESAHQEYAEQGIVILGVDQMESAEKVRDFIAEKEITFPVLLDKEGAVGHDYRVSGLPTTVFVRFDGTILDVVVGGPMSKAFIESKIKTLLEEKDGPI